MSTVFLKDNSWVGNVSGEYIELVGDLENGRKKWADQKRPGCNIWWNGSVWMVPGFNGDLGSSAAPRTSTNGSTATVTVLGISEGKVDIKFYKAVGLSVNQLKAKNLGYTTLDYSKAEYSSKDVLKEGFSLQDFVKDGVPVEWVNAGFTFSYSCKDLKAAGFSARSMFYGKYRVPELMQEGYPRNEVVASGAQASVLKDAGFLPQELVGHFSRDAIAGAGFNAGDLRQMDFRPEQLKDKGYSASSLRGGGFSYGEFRRDGLEVQWIKQSDNADAGKLRQVGYTKEEMKDGGYAASALLRQAGFDKSEVLGLGYSATSLRESDFKPQELRDAGYSLDSIASGGFLAGELRMLGYRPGLLRSKGYAAKQLLEGGYDRCEVAALEYPARELREAGYSGQQLRQANYNDNQILSAGFEANDLRALGFSCEKLKEYNYSAKSCLDAPVDIAKTGYPPLELMLPGDDQKGGSLHGKGSRQKGGSRHEVPELRDEESSDKVRRHHDQPVPVNDVTEVVVSCRWKDQGFGGTKGAIMLALERDGREVCSWDCFGTAPHDWQDVTRTFCAAELQNPGLGDELSINYVVGGGGGHQLHVEEFFIEFMYEVGQDIPGNMSEAVARDFIKALRNEYVQHKGAAVGEFMTRNSGSMDLNDIQQIENDVSQAQRPQAVIDDLEREWFGRR